MSGRFHDGSVREFVRARLEGRRAELARLGALVQGERLIDEILADLDTWEREQSGRLLNPDPAIGYRKHRLSAVV